MKLIFYVLFIVNFANISETTILGNVTCNKDKVCVFYIKFEQHCEELFGENCSPPCDIVNCKIKVENNVLCKHYYCHELKNDRESVVLIILLTTFTCLALTVAACFIIYTVIKKKLEQATMEDKEERQEKKNGNINYTFSDLLEMEFEEDLSRNIIFLLILINT